ncbi:MAG: hypothetical protein ETSY2_21300 [Candidatus Entotheonella gemina]|uniref:Abnormal spindle-like microcephaly-associated protein ASH domain-containing protein n=1 Tax=Candidatus Entotheonella gemina TaxID=1429439 RepID=W4M7V6_9BACT|nr:MAG: hypothetical protein ETSY2_21300 [Candidatus Entotheonella gemina]
MVFLETAGEVHTYTFEATEGNRITINMTTEDGTLAPSLELYDPMGLPLTAPTPLISVVAQQSGMFTVLAYSNRRETGTYRISLTLMDGEPEISAAPSSIDFGSTLIGEESSRTVVISSRGDIDLVVGDLSFTVEGVEAFSLINDNCSGQIVPVPLSCTVRVGFSPDASGEMLSTLVVPSNTSDNPVIEIPLSGTGVEPQ